MDTVTFFGFTEARVCFEHGQSVHSDGWRAFALPEDKLVTSWSHVGKLLAAICGKVSVIVLAGGALR